MNPKIKKGIEWLYVWILIIGTAVWLWLALLKPTFFSAKPTHNTCAEMLGKNPDPEAQSAILDMCYGNNDN